MKSKQLLSSLSLLLGARKALPKPHIYAASALSLFAFILIAYPSVPAEAKRSSKLEVIALPLEEQLAQEQAEATLISEIDIPALAVDSLDWRNFTIGNGDTLSGLFQRAGVPAKVIYQLTATEHGKTLSRLYPGEQLQFGINAEGALQELRYVQSKLEQHIYRQTDAKYQSSHEIREPEVLLTFATATIKDSLFLAGVEANIPQNVLMELANIFGWDIDFVFDIRKGDYVNLLYEEQYLDGEKVGTGKIVAAEFYNDGRLLKAVRYVDDEGYGQYYTPDGKPMRKAFLRTPVNFLRISSNFNNRRLHPVTGQVKPHRGTDYAAKIGTPVYAAGDGKVVASTYNGLNGNYVFIQHGQKYQTKYLHLSNRKVKVGQTVKQGQVIGLVGSTGRVTGPHLHYEFLVNGVHRNPRTVDLPDATPIAKQEMARFREQTEQYTQQLALYTQNQKLYASNSTNKNRG